MIAAYILNRVSSKSVSSIPYELWTCRKPYLNWLILGDLQLIFMTLLINIAS